MPVVRNMVAAVCFVVAFLGSESFVLGALISGCAAGSESNEVIISSGPQGLQSPSCTVSQVRSPTTTEDLANLYAHRSFYADGNHLGHDIKLLEGTAIHPIACGIVRVARPAKGYGRLVVVLEHMLPAPRIVTNGMGAHVTVSSFLSIYGHIRKSANVDGKTGVLGFSVGDTVGPDDVIGYVDNDAYNGDGKEHLHLGVRLQTAAAAQSVDTAWFRGYDTMPSQRKWYADPVLFLTTIKAGVSSAFWHPPGTLLRSMSNGSYWMIDGDQRRHAVPAQVVAQEHLAALAVDVTDAELSCDSEGAAFISSRAGHQVIKFSDSSAVYEYTGVGPGQWRMSFPSMDVFHSWGWLDAEIHVMDPSTREVFLNGTDDHGQRQMRDGSLVKSNANSEVAVVSQGQRLPIIDWDTFVALGYHAERIMTVPAGSIDQVAGPRGSLITKDLTSYCAYPSECVGDGCPDLGPGGGEGDSEEGIGEVGGSGSTGFGGSGAGFPSGGAGGAPGTGAGGNASTATTTTTTTTTTTNQGQGGNAPVPNPNVPPPGFVRFIYDGPVMPGVIQMQGMWDPPGPTYYDWVPSTFALCQDAVPGDGQLVCDLPMSSGTTNYLFTVHLPDGRWWGDLSCAPTGGCGFTIGTVTLLGPNGVISYVMQPNNSGPLYQNGYVAVVP